MQEGFAHRAFYPALLFGSCFFEVFAFAILPHGSKGHAIRRSLRGSAKLSKAGTLYMLPRSSTAGSGCRSAAFGRRTHGVTPPAFERGPEVPDAGKISCFPSS